MESSIHINIISCGITDLVTQENRHRIRDILRKAPSCNGEHTIFDQLIVFVPNCTRHIRVYYTWPYLIYGNSLTGKSIRIQSRQHGHPCLGHTVLSAVYTRHNG